MNICDGMGEEVENALSDELSKMVLYKYQSFYQKCHPSPKFFQI